MNADKRNIKIELCTRIQDQGQKQEHHQQLEGQLYEKETQTYIRYEEDLEGIGKVQNTLKIEGQQAKVIRHGAVSMNHTYQLGETTNGMYHSPHGPLEMETNTTQLQYVPIQGEGSSTSTGKFLLSYDLKMNGQPAGGFTLEMYFKNGK
jgi:uncharacterized beta-barrel protein YwiB (DUF1934 family)